MYNKVVLVGNLTRDIEIHYTPSGMSIAKSAIATSRKYKSNTGESKEEVCFLDVTFFGKTAEIANQYLRKGSKVLLDGRLVFEQWADKNTGAKRSKHSLSVTEMKMLGSKDESTAITHTNTQNTHQPMQPTQNQASSTQVPEIDIEEDEIPF